MTDARLGGLGREALVSDVGVARLGGLVREALVSGIGSTAKAGGRSGARGNLTVIFAGVILSASAHARSKTRVAVNLTVGLAGHIEAGSSARGQRTSMVSLAGRIGARSRGSIMRSNPATLTAWGHSKSRMRGALTVGPPPVLRQYAVTVGA